ncbi:MAG: hypothetical protein R3B51_00730 [Thermodesulfobacteriota bacterium]
MTGLSSTILRSKRYEGYHLPSAIAFVPEPGSGPKDPLYFVTELGERLKSSPTTAPFTLSPKAFSMKPREELPRSPVRRGLPAYASTPPRATSS